MDSVSQYDNFGLIDFFTSIVVLIFGFCLLSRAIPKHASLRHYYLACRILAVAYLTMAVMSLILFVPFNFQIVNYSDAEYSIKTLSSILFISSFQACLFLFSILALINVKFLKKRRICCHVASILVFSVVQLCCVHYASDRVIRVVLSIYIVAYAMQLIYYIYLFQREYSRYEQRLNNFFSEDEEKRIRWIKRMFYIAVVMASISILSVSGSRTLNIMISVLGTVFYIFVAMKYINYPSFFLYSTPLYKLYEEKEEKEEKEQGHEMEFIPRLEQWMGDKGYIEPFITLADLSILIEAPPKELSYYINDHFDQNFKLWIRALRIEEAKKILISHKDLPVEQVGEMVGILNKSSFFRQFQAEVKVTPGFYRKDNQSFRI